MQASSSDVKSSGSAINWDVLEKVIVVLLLGTLAMRLVPSALAAGHYQNWLLLLSEACVVLFVLLRRGTSQISLRPTDWALGFGGTLAPLLVNPSSDSPLLPVALCGFLMLLGLAVQLYAKFTLRRSFGIIAANRGVKVNGPYRIVRHPMYAGYVMTHVGFLLSGPTLWNLAVYAVALGLNIRRLIAEERVLIADPAYQDMCRKVRSRLLPYVF
ncbi:isoprenylcysteine carboxyl methyltransferase [Sphingopyxis lindanitolerans]|uniref:Isoprenylcysteine carboxyl methyltransferase n=1 Tax=Sphingopyxis lindanitolerans TaxID=2054227 RepID=A0A2S8BA76_9SPHN|nr:isoprenylcysteine carboxylmethyltransferase family protein [Sphingopyxis lindanitolerans]PQM29258.1 isoprenylcysteine carboxyl methyltransferase [Sphingopyxis lindanitolerans]